MCQIGQFLICGGLLRHQLVFQRSQSSKIAKEKQLSFRQNDDEAFPTTFSTVTAVKVSYIVRMYQMGQFLICGGRLRRQLSFQGSQSSKIAKEKQLSYHQNEYYSHKVLAYIHTYNTIYSLCIIDNDNNT